ncbi:hypothetical protein K4K52_007522 [Colletotrichum sp. SAR 10_76]|nr:hypothetical protein K4K52_007522 [Colletotrichum sp. SAR 10_76]
MADEDIEISSSLAGKIDVEAFVDEFVAWANDDSPVKLAHLWASPAAIYSLHGHSIISAATIELSCQSDDTYWSFTHYIHPNELQRFVAKQKQRECNFDVDSFTKLNLAQTGEDDQENKIVLIDAHEDFNIHYAVGMIQLSRTIGDALGSTGLARLRIVWLSPNTKPDSTLSRKMSTFAPFDTEKLQIEVFRLPEASSVAYLEDLSWKTYREDDQAFLRDVARSIAPEFMREAVEDGETAVTSPTHVAFLWDGIRRMSAYRPETFTEVLGKIVGPESFYTLTAHDTISRKSTDKAMVVKMGENPRLASLPAGTRHIILCNTRRQAQFDTGIAHVVVADAQASRADLKLQAELAFVNASKTPPGDVTIHSQLSLDDIDAMPASHLFEEIHMASFLVMAWDIDPRLVTLNNALIKKVALILPDVDFNIQTATFLAQMTSELPFTQRQGMIDLAAIALRFQPVTEQAPFIYFGEEIKVPGALAGDQGKARWEKIARDCRDVPSETMMQGPLWLALGVYRFLRQVRGSSPHDQSTIQLGNKLFTVETLQFDIIRAKADKIGTAMMQAIPPAATRSQGDSTELQIDDVSVLQKLMLRAWCHELVFTPGNKMYLDIASRKFDRIDVIRSMGFFVEMTGSKSLYLIGFDRIKSPLERSYSIRLSVMIPDAILADFVRETGLSYDALETRFPLYIS